MTDSDDVKVHDQPDRSRYEVELGDELAGFADYRLGPDGIVDFVHTEIDGRFEGNGLAGRLATWALDDVRRRGLRARPSCPFIKDFIERHPTYADLVAP